MLALNPAKSSEPRVNIKLVFIDSAEDDPSRSVPNSRVGPLYVLAPESVCTPVSSRVMPTVPVPSSIVPPKSAVFPVQKDFSVAGNGAHSHKTLSQSPVDESPRMVWNFPFRSNTDGTLACRIAVNAHTLISRKNVASTANAQHSGADGRGTDQLLVELVR